MDTSALYIYVGTFVALVAAGVGFPIPEELPIVTAGALAGHAAAPDPVVPPVPPEYLATLGVSPAAGFPAAVPWSALVVTQNPSFVQGTLPDQDSGSPPSSLRWWILLPVCILGVVISDGLLYGIGRIWGMRVLRVPWMRRLLPLERIEGIERNFQKYGVLILLIARVLPGIRSPMFITAGIMRLPFKRFVLADGVYAIPGVSLLFFLAYWFTNQFRDLVERAETNVVAKIRPILILAAIVAVAIYFLVHFLRRPVTTGDPKEIPLIGGQVAAKIQGVEKKFPVLHPEQQPRTGPANHEGNCTNQHVDREAERARRSAPEA